MKKILAVLIVAVLTLTLLISARADSYVAGNIYLYGDVDGNGVINMGDVTLVLNQFGATRNGNYGFANNQYDPDRDLDKNGNIGMFEVTEILNRFGQSSPWHLVNKDWEVINQTQYWSKFVFPETQEVNITFDNKGHAYFYLPAFGFDWISAALHQGSIPFFSNASYVFSFVPETKQMTVICSAMIDHEEFLNFLGSSRLCLNIWIHMQDQLGNSGEGLVSLDFDERGWGNLPVGGSTYYEQSHDGHTWLNFEYRLGSMNDKEWYSWSIDVNRYINQMVANIGSAPSSWQWVANALCSVRDVGPEMDAILLTHNCSAWVLDYCYFYVQG